MNKLIVGIILGWLLNISFYEYQHYEYFKLHIDALDQGYEWKKDGKFEINEYIEKNRTRFLDYINFKPELWTCVWVFEHDKCLISSLKREPIPIKDRPKR